MENFSKIGNRIELPLNIEVFPYLRDHVFDKHAVFPAVESMQLLAEAARSLQADLDVNRLIHAGFEKFLLLEPQDKVIEACAAFEKIKNKGVSAKLLTRMHLTESGITRVKEHARLTFFPRAYTPEIPDAFNPVESKPETDMEVAPVNLYRELVPFGPAYHNISGMVRLGRQAAGAEIRAPALPSANGALGSPFVLDAAFHAACVWGQRYSGFIGFPVGFDSRVILNKTKPDKTYSAQVTPAKQGRNENVFNLWICDPNGEVFEVVKGLRMRDVTGGRRKPPAWIQKNA